MNTPSREVFRKYTDDQTFDRIIEFGTVSEMWSRCSKEFADAIAITDAQNEYTYAQLDEDTARFRTLLKSDDDKPCIGILSSNSYDFVKAFIAAATLGYSSLILPAHLDDKSIYGCCMMYGVNTLVYKSALDDKVQLVKNMEPHIRLIPIEQTSDVRTEACECEPSDACAMMFTGGTTGKSKVAVLSNEAVMQGTVNGCYGYREVFGLKYMLHLPLSHVFGLIRNMMTSLYTGSNMFICANNVDLFRDIERFRPNILVTVPALAEMALSLSRKFGRNMLGKDMKYIICGAAMVSPYLIRAYHEQGIEMFAGYGLTESANLVSGNPESLTKPESVGIPYPNQQLRVENGELWLKGKNIMIGYVGADNSEAFEDGWFKTGDLVRFDDEGYLYIVGRIKEIIVLPSGENISPAEVETRFNELPFVQDSQVFEDIDEQGRHILALEIVPRASEIAKLGAEDSGAYMMEELEKVNKVLPSFERVQRITIRTTDFARTPSMKIARYHKC